MANTKDYFLKLRMKFSLKTTTYSYIIKNPDNDYKAWARVALDFDPKSPKFISSVAVSYSFSSCLLLDSGYFLTVLNKY